jgi:selenocysteine lyase/cysteine desulfurase
MTRTVEEFERLLPWIRSQFRQLECLLDGRPRIYLDNAAGTLVPQTVADAMAEAAVWANPQPGRQWPPGPETLREHGRARALLADFLNAGDGDRIFFSESTTASLYKLREALEPAWDGRHNVVVTDCDHFANISPWEWRARWEVRRAPMAPDGHLDPARFSTLLDGGTRVVALSLASNGLGTALRAEEAIRTVRERAPEAVVVVDAVHGAPHLPIDVQSLGADAVAFSTYKLFGPLCGILWTRGELARRLDPYHVEPHTDAETLLEWGTLDNAKVAGVRAGLEYLQHLGERLEPVMVGQWAGHPRPRRVFKLALSAIREYEASLSRRVLTEMPGAPDVTLFGVAGPDRTTERVPTFAFTVRGVADGRLERLLWEAGGVQVAAGSHYAASVLRGLGRATVARASFAHYNEPREADIFIEALRIASSTR